MIKFLIKRWWKFIERQDNKRISLKNPIVGIDEIRDLAYKGDEEFYHKLDIYRPQGNGEKLPVIFDIHGGGWAYGTKMINEYYCKTLSKEGFAVINLNYHLMFDKAYPEPVQDIFCAINFIFENSEKYGLDTRNFFITGDSAGAHYAALTATILGDKEMQKLFDVSPNDEISIKALGLTCGVYDFVPMLSLAKGLGKKYFAFLFGKEKNYENLPLFKACTIKNRLTNFPPSFINTSYKDFLQNKNIAFSETLSKAGVETKFYNLKKEESEHVLEHVYNVLYPEWKESIFINEEMCKFFKNHMK